MFGVVTHNQVWSDVDIYFSGAELVSLSMRDIVKWICMYQSPAWRSFSDLQIKIGEGVQNFLFTPQKWVLSSIDISESNATELAWSGKISERCSYSMDGTKILLTNLEQADNDGIWLSSLSVAWIHLAREQCKTQDQEEAIVMWLFGGVTQKEKSIISDILNP